jgi:hypothetical protein
MGIGDRHITMNHKPHLLAVEAKQVRLVSMG